jgi:hypothetical protein
MEKRQARAGTITRKNKTLANTDAINDLSLRGALRRSNPMKYEIATPFGLAMTKEMLKY